MLKRLLLHLRRETSGGAFVPQMDGLRFFAIGSVVLYHLDVVLTKTTGRFFSEFPNPQARTAFRLNSIGHPLHELADLGWFGVPLFFVISGFVLGLPFAKHALCGAPGISLKKYFQRRVTRLEPPYLISLLFYAAVWLFVKHQPIDYVLRLFLASAFYMHNLIYQGQGALSSVIWSLEVEVQFYILAPLLASVFFVRDTGKRRLLILGGVGLFSAGNLVVRHFLPNSATVLHYLQYFLIGFLLVDLYVVEKWSSTRDDRLRWDGFALAAAVLSAAGLHYGVGESVQPLLIFVMYYAAFRGRVLRAITENPFIYTVGGMCYTIYLYHAAILVSLTRITPRVTLTDGFALNFALQLAMTAPIVLVICSLLFVTFEKPFMRKHWPTAVAQWVVAAFKRLTVPAAQREAELPPL